MSGQGGGGGVSEWRVEAAGCLLGRITARRRGRKNLR